MYPFPKAIVTLGISALAFTPQTALAVEWVLVDKGGRVPANTYVDIASKKRTEATITYWVKVEFVDNKDGWEKLLLLNEANCTTNQERTLQATGYKVNGKIVDIRSELKWTYAIPETYGKKALDFACSLN